MKRWIEAVQFLYPKIYLACHVDHVRARSNPEQLSAHDASLLAHLEIERPLAPAQLARHLRVQPSTLSPAIARLERLGLLTRDLVDGDRRRHELRLTERGRRAVSSHSALDSGRLALLARELDAEERRRAVEGLELLVEAARRQALHRRT